MKKILIAASMLSLIVASCNDSGTKKEEAATSDSSANKSATPATEAPTASAPLDSATMMKNWMAYSTPGDMHKLLQSWDGTWTGEITSWMTPGAPPQVSTGKAVNKMILGGRYQESIHTSDMMGMPFEGRSVMGYDNAKKKFVSTWVDNMGTGVMTMEGTWDEGSKTLTTTGKCIDPAAGNAKEMDIRQVLKVVDDKNHVFEMYGPGPDGKEFKMMEIKMTRK
ncbi:MAG: DUF1579 domain-containing protein [Ferruginibacter sp.]